MCACWQTEPEERPNFDRIVDRLRQIIAAVPANDKSEHGAHIILPSTTSKVSVNVSHTHANSNVPSYAKINTQAPSPQHANHQANKPSVAHHPHGQTAGTGTTA